MNSIQLNDMEKSEILKYIGNLSQQGGCRHYVLSDGWGRGLRASDIDTGSGLRYTVLPDRGMDISLASYKGMNLVYLTCNGETHPSYYEPEGIGWLRTFAAGLLTTCGLTYLGPPCEDDGQRLGLHGRYSTLPARQFSDLSGWNGNEYLCRVRGIIEEGHIFGHKLRLEREISSACGQNVLRIADKITNYGNAPSPFTILYHMNFGYPLLTEDAELLIDPEDSSLRVADAENGIMEFKSFTKPQPAYHEQVFFHTMKGDEQGLTSVTLRNKKAGMAVTLRFNIRQLPYVTEWKMMGYGEYVLGIEPCNVLCKSRKALRSENALPMLQPGEITSNLLELSVTDLA
jgi:hypothetical protein